MDDHSQLGFGQVMASERKEDVAAFQNAAAASYRKLGNKVERVMTDSGSCLRLRTFSKTCAALGFERIGTRPCTHNTNGRAERFIQLSLREWAFGRAYRESEQRRADLPHWRHHYIWHRPYACIKREPPISRSGLGACKLMVCRS